MKVLPSFLTSLIFIALVHNSHSWRRNFSAW